jgi:protein dithiol oxidoreductase (disulfide-forming)
VTGCAARRCRAVAFGTLSDNVIRRMNFFQGCHSVGGCHHKDSNVNRRDFSARLVATGAGAAAATFAGTFAAPALAQGTPLEGKQFAKIEPPVPTTVPGKIEVIEFFSYACPHCNEFEPTLEAWAKGLPADTVLHRVPVPFLMNAENFMRLYYSLETLGQVDAMQSKIFATVHVEHKYLEKPADIAALMQKNGIDSAKFMDVFNSFSVATSVARAKKMLGTYHIDAVPTLAVQGRYTTSPSQAGSLENAVKVADYLIDRSRKGA